MPGAIDGHVDAAVACVAENFARRVGSRWIEDGVGAQGTRQVRGDGDTGSTDQMRADAGQFQHRDGQQPDGARAEDHRRLTRPRRGEMHGVHDHRQRLHQRAFRIAQMLRQRQQDCAPAGLRTRGRIRAHPACS